MTLLCPLDGLPLTTAHGTARCSANHAYDWAKEGYLNLLPVHAKQSKDPGDSSEMVQARRRFLNSGSYDPIIDAIAHHMGERNIILDAGCGEGYYLNKIQHDLNSTELYGLDISKHAVRAAAKKYTDITWLVASNRQLPFPSQSLDVILCAFGFPVWPEFKRVLKPDGIVILVDSGPDHLLELRQLLYNDIKIKESSFTVPDEWQLVMDKNLSYPINLTTSGMIRDLIAMTPHQHRATSDAIDTASETGFSNLTVNALIRILSP